MLVTGASGGIGAASAIRLAKKSLDNPDLDIKAIAIHYNANAGAADKVASSIANCNSKILVKTFRADMGSSSDVERLHNEVVKAFGPVDVLFANAGTTSGKSGPTGGLEDVELDDFEKTWRVNTLAPYQLTQLVVPDMLKKHFGRIIYNSSVAALTGGVVGPHVGCP